MATRIERAKDSKCFRSPAPQPVKEMWMNPTRKRIQLGKVDSCKTKVRLRCLNEILDEEKKHRNDTKGTVHGLGSAAEKCRKYVIHMADGNLDP